MTLHLTVHAIVVFHTFPDAFRCDFDGFSSRFAPTDFLVILTTTSSDKEHTHNGKQGDDLFHNVTYGFDVYQLPSARWCGMPQNSCCPAYGPCEIRNKRMTCPSSAAQVYGVPLAAVESLAGTAFAWPSA